MPFLKIIADQRFAVELKWAAPTVPCDVGGEVTVGLEMMGHPASRVKPSSPPYRCEAKVVRRPDPTQNYTNRCHPPHASKWPSWWPVRHLPSIERTAPGGVKNRGGRSHSNTVGLRKGSLVENQSSAEFTFSSNPLLNVDKVSPSPLFLVTLQENSFPFPSLPLKNCKEKNQVQNCKNLWKMCTILHTDMFVIIKGSGPYRTQ